jgi:hypothetical protein
VKVTLTVCVPPLTTLTMSDTEDVAMAVFGVAAGPGVPIVGELDG